MTAIGISFFICSISYVRRVERSSLRAKVRSCLLPYWFVLSTLYDSRLGWGGGIGRWGGGRGGGASSASVQYLLRLKDRHPFKPPTHRVVVVSG